MLAVEVTGKNGPIPTTCVPHLDLDVVPVLVYRVAGSGHDDGDHVAGLVTHDVAHEGQQDVVVGVRREHGNAVLGRPEPCALVGLDGQVLDSDGHATSLAGLFPAVNCPPGGQ